MLPGISYVLIKIIPGWGVLVIYDNIEDFVRLKEYAAYFFYILDTPDVQRISRRVDIELTPTHHISAATAEWA